MKQYDLIIIGTGGATKLSTAALKQGKKVAIIEKDKPGGTCLNRGCIPSKMLIHPANVVHHLKESEKLGVHATAVTVDMGSLVSRTNKVVDDESAGIGSYYTESEQIDYYHDKAHFINNTTLEVGGEHITAPIIVLGVGSRPQIPKIEGLDGTPYMTSTEALRLTQKPKKMIVIGGGYIACELGSAYAGYGTDVQFVVRSSMLKNEDKEVQAEFTKKFMSMHKIEFGFESLSVSHENNEFTLTVTKKEGETKTFTADALLVATGVVSNADLLNLDATDIKVNSRGHIEVDDCLETSVPGVYALGDVIGKYLFRHSANFEGEYLANYLFLGEPKKPIEYPPMPHAVFSYPEIAGVGKTEQQLEKDGVDYVKSVHPYKSSGQGMARMSDHGFVKLLFDKQSQKLIGCHIIGDEAATMIHQAIYAMTFGGTALQLLNMIYIHPGLPEVLRNAVRKAIPQFNQ